MLKLPEEIAAIATEVPSRIQNELLNQPFCRPKEVPTDYNPFRSVLGNRAEDPNKDKSELESGNNTDEPTTDENSSISLGENTLMKLMQVSLVLRMTFELKGKYRQIFIYWGI